MGTPQLRLGQAQHWRVLKIDRVTGEPKVRLIVIGTECDALSMDLRNLFVRVHHRDVIRSLVVKNAELGRSVFADR